MVLCCIYHYSVDGALLLLVVVLPMMKARHPWHHGVHFVIIIWSRSAASMVSLVCGATPTCWVTRHSGENGPMEAYNHHAFVTFSRVFCAIFRDKRTRLRWNMVCIVACIVWKPCTMGWKPCTTACIADETHMDGYISSRGIQRTAALYCMERMYWLKSEGQVVQPCCVWYNLNCCRYFKLKIHISCSTWTSFLLLVQTGCNVMMSFTLAYVVLKWATICEESQVLGIAMVEFWGLQWWNWG